MYPGRCSLCRNPPSYAGKDDAAQMGMVLFKGNHFVHFILFYARPGALVPKGNRFPYNEENHIQSSAEGRSAVRNPAQKRRLRPQNREAAASQHPASFQLRRFKAGNGLHAKYGRYNALFYRLHHKIRVSRGCCHRAFGLGHRISRFLSKYRLAGCILMRSGGGFGVRYTIPLPEYQNKEANAGGN